MANEIFHFYEYDEKVRQLIVKYLLELEINHSFEESNIHWDDKPMDNFMGNHFDILNKIEQWIDMINTCASHVIVKEAYTKYRHVYIYKLFVFIDKIYLSWTIGCMIEDEIYNTPEVACYIVRRSEQQYQIYVSTEEVFYRQVELFGYFKIIDRND